MTKPASPETPDERKSRIFGERARRLARGAHDEDDGADRTEVVEFLLGDERCAVESRYVGEVFPPFRMTPIPCTPSFVAGVVNLRGRIVSVVDLKILFGMPAPERSEHSERSEPGKLRERSEPRAPQRIVLLCSDDMELGLLADGVPGIAVISRALLHPPLPALTGARGTYILGIGGNGLAVLDGAKILSDGSLIVNEEP